MTKEELQSLLSETRSRGEVKNLGRRVDREPKLRAAMESLARTRGKWFEPDWSGKRLVRLLLDREGEARIRTNPIHRDGGFQCAYCGEKVPAGGAMVRDHCHLCLRGLHVDQTPGDRAADCGGILHPVAMELAGRAGVIIHYRCDACGHRWRGRAHPEDAIPPSLNPSDIDVQAAERPKSATTKAARTLPLRVLESIRRQRLWQPGQTVLVAVSGGLDSTVLMEVLVQIQGGHGGKLEVASVDHGLRPESVAEVAQVGRRARQLGLPFHGLSVSIGAGGNLQARARDARRLALTGIGLDRVALGHHQNDQAETVLYHLLRGSGAKGLRGMQASDQPWVRPLLNESRETLLEWAKSQGLSWVEDPSNPASQRGQLRTLMPLLDAIHGGAVSALARSARILSREDALLASMTDTVWQDLDAGTGLNLSDLQALHPAICLRVLRRFVAPCPHPVRADQLEPIQYWNPQGGASLDLGSGWVIRFRNGHLFLHPPE